MDTKASVVHPPCLIEGCVGPHFVFLVCVHLQLQWVHTESMQRTITTDVVDIFKHSLLVENTDSFNSV